MHMLDALQARVLAQDHVVKTELSEHGERGVEAGQPFQGGIGLDEIVPIENAEAVFVAHGNHRAVEIAAVSGLRGAALGLQRIGIDLFAAPVFQRGDGVGADTLRHEAGLGREGRIRAHGTTVGPHGHARHGFDTAGHHQVFPAGGHFLRGDIDRLQARGAEAIELDTGNGLIPIGVLHDHFGHVRALFADRRHAAHNHIVHAGGVQIVTRLECAQKPRA